MTNGFLSRFVSGFSLRPWQRHSLVLLVAGIVYIGVGISYVTAQQTGSREVALQIALKWMSYDNWGMVFIAVGVMGIVSSRWPRLSETWGYTLFTGLSAMWSAFYLTGIVFGDSPVTNLSSSLTWGLIAFVWWAISGLLNPPKEKERRKWIQRVLPPSS